jgi:hypothetical protein
MVALENADMFFVRVTVSPSRTLEDADACLFKVAGGKQCRLCNRQLNCRCAIACLLAATLVLLRYIRGFASPAKLDILNRLPDMISSLLPVHFPPIQHIVISRIVVSYVCTDCQRRPALYALSTCPSDSARSLHESMAQNFLKF